MLAGNRLLTPVQQAFLAHFATLPDQEHFYLAGGTALAEYYLGHRLSFDLDLFTPYQKLILPLSYRIEALRVRDATISVVRRFASYVEFSISLDDEMLKIDLAQDSPFRLESLQIAESGVRVSALADLRVDKLLAYYGRAEPRDAVDLYFILKQVQLDELAGQARLKDPGFDLYWFAVALQRAVDFPDELERWPVKMLQPFDPRQLKREFEALYLNILGTMGGNAASPPAPVQP